MKLKFLVDEDFVNYKKPSMFIGFPRCSFKCGAENCQNFCLAKEPNIEINTDDVIERFIENPITEAVVLGGLEPFDSWPEVEYFIMKFRYHSDADIVIYSGYNVEEIPQEIHEKLKLYSHDGPIIVKYGRYIPNTEGYYSSILGVRLASQNQIVKYYGDKI